MGGESKVIEVKSRGEWEKALVTAGAKAVIVDFSATWCGPCRMIKPIFAALSIEFGNVVFLTIDVDHVSDVAAECGVSAMPTFQVYKHGEKVGELVGASEGKLLELIKKHA